MTININRLVQNAVRDGVEIGQAVEVQVRKIHKYLTAFNEIIIDMQKYHMIPLYDAGFVSPEKQYMTIGINGLAESAEFLGIEVLNTSVYSDYVNSIMEPIFRLNKSAKSDLLMFNTEMVPAENLGVKNASWDKKDGYFVPRNCYNSYFYIVENPNTNIVDKFKMHGSSFISKLDGGSALHCNLEEHLTKDQYAFLLKLAVKSGCNYFTFNVPNTLCNACGYISKHKLNACPKCGSENIDYATRIIGYLTLISKWS